MIHSTALQATGASSEPASFVELDRGRISLVVPNEIYQDLSQDEQSAGPRNGAKSNYRNPCRSSRLSGCDRNSTQSCIPIPWTAYAEAFRRTSIRPPISMDMNIAAMSIIRPVEMLLIPKLLGLQSAAHDDETNAPYPLHPDLQQFYDQQRESDETYRATRTEQ